MENLLTRDGKDRALAWCIYIVTIDIFLIIFTIISRYFNEFPLKQFFNLGGEMNFSTWWSGICLLGSALLGYEMYCTRGENQNRRSWLILSILFMGLFGDEIGSFHERIGSFSRLLPYGIIAIFLLCYSLFYVMKEKNGQITAMYLFVGFLLFGFVAGIEYLEHIIKWPYWMSGIREGIEEGSELLGELFILIGIIKQRGITEKPYRLQSVISNPYNFKSLNFILAIGLVIHAGSSLFITQLNDLDMRGNPAVLYPSLVYFILFCASYWNYEYFNDDKRKIWLFISAYFMLCSICAVQFPIGKPVGFLIYYIIHIMIVSLFYVKMIDKYFYKHILYLFICIGALIYIFVTKNIVYKYILSGVVPFIIADIFINKKSYFYEFTDKKNET